MKILTLYKKLMQDDTDINLLVGDSIYIEQVMQKTPRPYVLLELPEQGEDYTHSGPVCIHDAHVMCTVHSDTSKQASDLGEAIMKLFKVYKGTEFDMEVQLTMYMNSRSKWDDGAKVFNHVSEYTSFFKEVTA